MGWAQELKGNYPRSDYVEDHPFVGPLIPFSEITRYELQKCTENILTLTKKLEAEVKILEKLQRRLAADKEVQAIRSLMQCN